MIKNKSNKFQYRNIAIQTFKSCKEKVIHSLKNKKWNLNLRGLDYFAPEGFQD